MIIIMGMLAAGFVNNPPNIHNSEEKNILYIKGSKQEILKELSSIPGC